MTEIKSPKDRLLTLLFFQVQVLEFTHLLPAAEAVSLLQALIGERAIADPAATQELAAQCSWLPLALRVAAELAAARPAIALAGLVQTVFRGTTLRSMLLEAYGFWQLGQIALYAAIASFIGAGLILILSIAGLFHGRRVTAETEVLGKAVQTSAASA